MDGKTGNEWALAAVNETQRARLFADMRAYLDWAEAHPSAPIPLAPVMNARVPDFPEDGQREAYVRWFAAQHGVPVVEKDGCLSAVHPFGGVTVEAHCTSRQAQADRWHGIVHGARAA